MFSRLQFVRLACVCVSPFYSPPISRAYSNPIHFNTFPFLLLIFFLSSFCFVCVVLFASFSHTRQKLYFCFLFLLIYKPLHRFWVFMHDSCFFLLLLTFQCSFSFLSLVSFGCCFFYFQTNYYISALSHLFCNCEINSYCILSDCVYLCMLYASPTVSRETLIVTCYAINALLKEKYKTATTTTTTTVFTTKDTKLYMYTMSDILDFIH